MKTLWIVLIALACLVVGFVAGGVAGFFIGFAAGSAASGPGGLRMLEGVTTTVTAPPSVKVGETFTVVVTIQDTLNKPRTIGDIDIHDDYLAAGTIVSVDPPPASSHALLGYRVHTMKARLAPGATKTVTFTLKASTPGAYAGDVDVYVDSEMLFDSHRVTTTVEP